MSGGGGGGGNNQQQAPAPAGTPMQTIQPGMPGQISTLADQLAAGFGQNPADMLSQLQQYYQPMSIPNYAPVAPTAPTSPTTPTPHSPATTPLAPGFKLNDGLSLPSNWSTAGKSRPDRTWGR